MGKPVGDPGKDGEVPVVVEKQVELYRPFCLVVGCPVEEGQTKLDKGGVEAEELVPEAELPLPRGCRPDLLEELVKDRFIQLPGSLCVGIRQGRA